MTCTSFLVHIIPNHVCHNSNKGRHIHWIHIKWPACQSSTYTTHCNTMAGVAETFVEDFAKSGMSLEVTQARPPRGVTQWLLKGNVSGGCTKQLRVTLHNGHLKRVSLEFTQRDHRVARNNGCSRGLSAEITFRGHCKGYPMWMLQKATYGGSRRSPKRAYSRMPLTNWQSEILVWVQYYFLPNRHCNGRHGQEWQQSHLKEAGARRASTRGLHRTFLVAG